jgi:precorrin-3B methylase
MKLPPAHTPEWRLMHAQNEIRAGLYKAINYLTLVGDPNPKHTAAQAIWREAIETTARAVPVANDTAPLPLVSDGDDGA